MQIPSMAKMAVPKKSGSLFMGATQSLSWTLGNLCPVLSSTAKKKAKIITRPNAWAQLARKEKGARYLKEERTVGFTLLNMPQKIA